jgi:hypothetical protein
MKMHPVGAEFLHADRWTSRHTDVIKLIVIFLQFCEHTYEVSELYRKEEGIELILSQRELVGMGPEEPFLLSQPIGDTQIV